MISQAEIFLFGDYLTLPNLLYTFFDVIISSRAHSLELSWVECVIRIGLSKVLKTVGKGIRSAYSVLQRPVMLLLFIVNLFKGFAAALCGDIELAILYVGVG